ncbi:MAG: ABC transporter permease [Bacteroidota bacterium]
MKKFFSSGKGPPGWARQFFRWYCHTDFIEDLEGDLDEVYEERLCQVGRRRANWLFVQDVLLLFRPSIIRRFTTYSFTHNQYPAMFRNYFKTGIRNLLKYKSYALLNIFGLAVGIAATILLFLIVRYEKSFDKFHSDYPNIYQLGERNTSNGISREYYLTRTPAFPTMREEYVEVVGGTRFHNDQHNITYQDQTLESSVHYVDSSFATTFDFTVLEGDLKQTLQTPNYIALTSETAEKIFGNEGPLGKVLDIDQGEQTQTRFTVGAILDNPPKNSSLQFKILIPWLNVPPSYSLEQNGNWYNSMMTTFIRLAPGTDQDAFTASLDPFREKYYTKYEGAETEIILLPLEEMRSENAKNQTLITLLSAIALIILAVATINFMNLSTAQSLGRVKEIGLRKVMGSRRAQLISQFLTESTLTSAIALLIAIALVYVASPWVNDYFKIGLTFSFWNDSVLLLTLLGVGLITGLLSGFYPALFVSNFGLTKSLRGEWRRSLSGQFLQKGLIVLQYTCSILLIAGTVVIWRQINYMKTKDLNFEQQNIVGVWTYNKFKDEEKAKSGLKVLRDELERETIIESVAFSGNVPSKYWFNYNSFYPTEQPAENKLSLRQSWVDDQYFPTYGITFAEGRNFSSDITSDSSAIVINEAAMKAFGWQDIEEKYLRYGCTNCEQHRVVGVVEDFHYQGLQSEVEPMAHFYGGNEPDYTFMSVRFQPGHVVDGLALLKDRWQWLDPIGEVDYFFLDQEFDQLYKSQERIGMTATLFAFIAIIIASLGLLGLAAFATRQRRKEVGVRKVLGASIIQIVVLLSRNFALLVMVAFLLACPLVYYAADEFLQDFAYRVPIRVDIFIIAGIAAILIAGISVSLQAFRAASVNPVHSLRDE